MTNFTIVGAPAPVKKVNPDPNELSYPASDVPPPPEYLPEMKDATIVKNTIQALSPRIVAVRDALEENLPDNWQQFWATTERYPGLGSPAQCIRCSALFESTVGLSNGSVTEDGSHLLGLKKTPFQLKRGIGHTPFDLQFIGVGGARP